MLRVAYDYFGRDKTPEEMALTLAVYQQMLADIPFEQLQAAARQHIASAKFFPAIAELRTAALALAQEPVLERTALEAWGRVKRAFSDGSFYPYADRIAAPDFSDDPILVSVVNDLGGLLVLFNSPNETADRARFVEAYAARQERARADGKLLPQVRALRDRLAGERQAAVAGLFKQVTDRLEAK